MFRSLKTWLLLLVAAFVAIYELLFDDDDDFPNYGAPA